MVEEGPKLSFQITTEDPGLSKALCEKNDELTCENLPFFGSLRFYVIMVLFAVQILKRRRIL